MEYIAFAVIFITVIVAWNGKDWITAHWNGKAEASREDRLAAEARAREAEAKLTQMRIDANRM